MTHDKSMSEIDKIMERSLEEFRVDLESIARHSLRFRINQRVRKIKGLRVGLQPR